MSGQAACVPLPHALCFPMPDGQRRTEHVAFHLSLFNYYVQYIVHPCQATALALFFMRICSLASSGRVRRMTARPVIVFAMRAWRSLAARRFVSSCLLFTRTLAACCGDTWVDTPSLTPTRRIDSRHAGVTTDGTYKPTRTHAHQRLVSSFDSRVFLKADGNEQAAAVTREVSCDRASFDPCSRGTQRR